LRLYLAAGVVTALLIAGLWAVAWRLTVL